MAQVTPQQPLSPAPEPEETPQPQRHEAVPDESRTRPAREDYGGDQGGEPTGSADREAPRPGVDPRLRKQVEDTEAWVARLQRLKAEGTRLSQDVRGQVRIQGQPQQAHPPDDISQLVNALNTGDREFVETLLNVQDRRQQMRTVKEKNDNALVDRITGIVNEHAPDVPMPLFWLYTEEAIAMAPGDTTKQIQLAISLSRRALKERDERISGRRSQNTENVNAAETLDRGSVGPRGDASAERSTMVDDMRAMQRMYRVGNAPR